MLAGLVIAGIGDWLWIRNYRARATAAPWAAAPNTLHHSDAVPAELRDYLDHVAGAIRTRVDHLTDHAVTEQPAWTEAIGEAPTDEATHERWRTGIALATAHRDQMRVDTDDPAHPFALYPETGRAGHQSWWAAASAALAIANTVVLYAPTGLADSAEAQLADAITRDLYQALPESERGAVRQTLADRFGSVWDLVTADPRKRLRTLRSGGRSWWH